MKAPEAPFYTVEQIAKMLGKKESTVKRYVRKGVLKGKWIGRVWVMPVKKFEEEISAVNEQPSKPRRLSAITRNKMEFRVMLRSLGNLPEKIARVKMDIRKTKDKLPENPGPEHVAAIQRLKENYALLDVLKKMERDKDERIEEMSADAYPEIAGLLGRERKEIIAILATGTGKIAPPLGETLKQHQEDDARRRQDIQRWDTTQIHQSNPVYNPMFVETLKGLSEKQTRAQSSGTPEAQEQPQQHTEPPTRETPVQGAAGQNRLFESTPQVPRGQQHTKTKSVGGTEDQ